MMKDGLVSTPFINGTFLNGITRQRIMQLLVDDGYKIEEKSIDLSELMEADELFATGNYSKICPCKKIEDRNLQVGPVATRARELYFSFVETI